MARKRFKAGSTFTKRVTRGKNKGKRTTFKVARGGKPYPIRRSGKKIRKRSHRRSHRRRHGRKRRR